MKYLASDLDGTLVHNGEISKEDRDAIRELKAKGYKFIVSTGRSIRGIEEAFKNYPEIEYDYAVGCNGSIILDKDKNVVYENYINSYVGQDVLRNFMNEEKCCMHFESDNINYLIDPITTDDIEEHMNYFQEIASREDVLTENRKYTTISLFTRDRCIQRAQEIRDRIAFMYEDKLEVFRNQYFIDIAPKECSKGNGINRVLDIDGGNVEKLYTIGDSFNDISMFKITENSFTFNNAEELVKIEANNHVDTVKECIDRILE